jgi:outer membrane lipoprotein-sorting protein
MVSFRAGLAGRKSTTMKSVQLICVAAMCVAASPARTAEMEALQPWFQAQAGMQTWAADLVQTRSLKTLVHPLVSTGRVWFAHPNRFRWELGTPAQTIALRATNEMWVIYPRLERAERFPLDAAGPWRDALALLETGFPETADAMHRQFQLISLTATNARLEVVLRPKVAAARKLIPRFSLEVDTNVWGLLATEMQFADGSRLRNDFFNVKTNPSLEAGLFSPPISNNYRIVEPLKGRN